ncbi:MAG: type II secretion system F family protein [Candidatus Buchananbacteria bacterium]
MNLEKAWQNWQKIPAMQKIFMVQNLAVMIKVGISLSEALKTLALQSTSKKLANILVDLQQKVEKGNELGKSLEIYQKDFGELFVNMVKAGEASGKLEDVLNQLYIQMKKDHEISSKIKGAMIYPIIVVTTMLVVGVLMMIYVIPSLTVVFKEVDVELPLATRILINTSDFMAANTLWLGLAGLVLVVAIIKFFSTETGKFWLSKFTVYAPIISPVAKKINLARFSRTLSSLLKTDIAIIQTLQITSQVITNRLYRQALLEAAEKVKKGVRLAEIFNDYPRLFPPLIIQMITVGEETGAIDDILDKIANYYEEDVTQTMNTLPSIIEPVLMVVLGVAVAGMAVAVIMPMYTLTETM